MIAHGQAAIKDCFEFQKYTAPSKAAKRPSQEVYQGFTLQVPKSSTIILREEAVKRVGKRN